MAWTILILLACVGCFLAVACGGAPPPTLADPDGDLPEIAPAQRQALAAILARLEIPTDSVAVLQHPADRTGGSMVSMRDGSVVRAELRPPRSEPSATLPTDDGDAEQDLGTAIEQLEELEWLSLEGPIGELEIEGHPALRELELATESASDLRLVLRDLKRLEYLSVRGHAAVDSGAIDLDLDGLAELRSLSLQRTGVGSQLDLDGLALSELWLTNDRVADLSFLAGQNDLESLTLIGNQLRDLATMPSLPRLRTLRLADNPLSEELRLDLDRVPNLGRVDLRRTGLRSVPPTLAAAEILVQLGEEVELENEVRSTLARLREAQAEAPGELVEGLGSTSGRAHGVGGRCQTSSSTLRRGEISCDLSFDRIVGTTSARLTETELTMPFKGGGTPRVDATVEVSEGRVALYARQRFDLIQTVRVITDAPEELAERFREPGDTFDGYRKVVAVPGTPATVTGEVSVIGTRVVLWLSAVEGEARGVRLTVRPD